MDRKQVAGRNQSKGTGHALLSFSAYPKNSHNLWNDQAIDSASWPATPAWRPTSTGTTMRAITGSGTVSITLTLKGMVDTEKTAYAVIEVYPDRLAVKGFGRQTDREMPLSNLPR